MNPRIQRAQLLFRQSRWDLAEKELRAALADDPEDWLCHAMLSFALLRQEKVQDAVAEAQRAVGHQPDASYAHYVLALAFLDAGKDAEARAAASRALEIDPADPDYHSLLGWMDLGAKRWSEALANAEKGLALDPEHVQSANVRAQALVKLGRGKEAGDTLGTALAREPESDLTHANMGWTLLEGGDHRKALEHFREALRLDPTSEWAREGIVEAMKARNPLYRGMLRYFFWMGKLQGRMQWVLIIGAVVGLRALRAVARDNPSFEPVATGISVLYILFMAATWLAKPLFDLLLRFDSFGRLCLSEDQVKGSSWLGATLMTAAGLGLAGWLMPNASLVTGALGCLALCLPVSGVYQVRNPKRRRVHAAYATALGAIGFAALALPGEQQALGMVFALGIIAYSWVANLYR
jgi:Tfp pilus assembly protein PilF